MRKRFPPVVSNYSTEEVEYLIRQQPIVFANEWVSTSRGIQYHNYRKKE